MATHLRVVEVSFSENPPPDDVLVEHIAYALQEDFKESRVADVRMHPFEGPVVFDDSPQLEEFVAPDAVKLEESELVSAAIRGLTLAGLVKRLRGADK